MHTLIVFLRIFQFIYFPFFALVLKSLAYYHLQTHEIDPLARDFIPLLKKVVIDLGLVPIAWLFFVFLFDYLVFQKKRVFFLLPVWIWQLYLMLALSIEKGVSNLYWQESNFFDAFSFALRAVWLVLIFSLFFFRNTDRKSPSPITTTPLLGNLYPQAPP